MSEPPTMQAATDW